MRANLVLLFLVACADSPAQLNITKQIGGEGGTVGVSDTSVQIPAGALSTPSNITISAVDAPAPANAVVVGPAFDFGPDGLTFSSPVTLTLPFDASKIPSGSSAANILVYTAQRGSGDYTALSATVNGSAVQAQTTHFTVYLPAVPVFAGVDLGSSVDLACGSPVCQLDSSGSGGCSCTQTCAGHTFSLSCIGSTSASCDCTVDGSPQGSPFSGQCISSTGLESIFFSQCGAS